MTGAYQLTTVDTLISGNNFRLSLLAYVPQSCGIEVQSSDRAKALKRAAGRGTSAQAKEKDGLTAAQRQERYPNPNSSSAYVGVLWEVLSEQNASQKLVQHWALPKINGCEVIRVYKHGPRSILACLSVNVCQHKVLASAEEGIL